ncbi:hypothetical protein HAX54_028586 [Datura stramonium]|uniref:Secreted protein n=1 Tax=Datura stramonium TaxID=4076 RepID=A0ABS8V7M7_DATST|nr:hypothetical protein [Datura stramonium]
MDPPLYRLLLFCFCPLACRPLKDRSSFGKSVHTLLCILEISLNQSWVKSSIDGPSFRKTVRPSYRTLQTHFSWFLKPAFGKRQTEVRTIFQTDGPYIASSFDQFPSLNSFLLSISWVPKT